MYNTKTYDLAAFDGKIVLSAAIDQPNESSRKISEYLSSIVDECNEFVVTKLYDAIKKEYFSNYQEHKHFQRYVYELKIAETYSNTYIKSYLISVTLKKGNETVFHNFISGVFYNDMLVPTRLICGNSNKAVVLKQNGIPAIPEFTAGEIKINEISKKKFGI